MFIVTLQMKKRKNLANKDDQYFAGKVLIATSGMNDSRFHRAVIFLCAHDAGGAMGLVINHIMTNVTFNDLIDQLKIESDIKVNFKGLNLPIMCGGPVEKARGFLLHSGDFVRSETLEINKSYGITGTVDALKDVALGKGPKSRMFALGYAGWDAGQLEVELAQNAWLLTDPDEDLIFSPDYNKKWIQAIEKLGIDPAMLSVEAGRA